MVKLISYSHQSINSSDIRAVTSVLKSSWLTTGPWVDKFEIQVAKLVGAKYAVAVANGTAALHLASLAAGFTRGNEVITSPYSFAATANSVLYCGAKPIFADVDPVTLCLDPKKVETKITRHTKAIIGVDFGGRPANWKKLREIARKYHLLLIDDAAHSFGSKYYGKRIGTQADLTCFSFHPVKTITTGEGGMVVTNNQKLYELVKTLRTHGIVKNPNHGIKPWYYEMKELGFNYRLTDIQAALGLSQLKQLNRFLSSRRKLARRYNRLLIKLEAVTLPSPSDESAWHLYPLRINFKKLGKTRMKLFRFMDRYHIGLQVHYIPIHLHPYYRKRFGYKRGDFPVAEAVYEQEVSLPLYPTLTLTQQNRIINLLTQFIAS